MKKRKKSYIAMTVSALSLEVDSPVLAGSITDVKIETGELSVTAFDGDGTSFPDDGFVVDFD